MKRSAMVYAVMLLSMIGIVNAQDAAEVPAIGNPYEQNRNNSLNYPFPPYAVMEEVRLYGNAFLRGAQSDNYAPNVSVCFNRGLNLAQYDVDLLVIKWMFGDARDNTLNFTLFLQNVSLVSYSCIDGLENLFVWSVYKYEQFGNNFNNVLLALL